MVPARLFHTQQLEVKHIYQVYVASDLNMKLLCFLTYPRYNMNFHGCEKQIFKFFDCTKIRKDSK